MVIVVVSLLVGDTYKPINERRFDHSVILSPYPLFGKVFGRPVSQLCSTMLCNENESIKFSWSTHQQICNSPYRSYRGRVIGGCGMPIIVIPLKNGRNV